MLEVMQQSRAGVARAVLGAMRYSDRLHPEDSPGPPGRRRGGCRVAPRTRQGARGRARQTVISMLRRRVAVAHAPRRLRVMPRRSCRHALSPLSARGVQCEEQRPSGGDEAHIAQDGLGRGTAACRLRAVHPQRQCQIVEPQTRRLRRSTSHSDQQHQCCGRGRPVVASSAGLSRCSPFGTVSPGWNRDGMSASCTPALAAEPMALRARGSVGCRRGRDSRERPIAMMSTERRRNTTVQPVEEAVDRMAATADG